MPVPSAPRTGIIAFSSTTVPHSGQGMRSPASPATEPTLCSTAVSSELGPLSAEEVRVVGALIEKQLTTPDYYPLTLNALLNACNQSSNRNPVVAYDDRTVQAALDRLRDEEGIVRIVHSVHNRAAKWRQVIDERLALEPEELALLGVLLLRGQQTLGELKSRTKRMHAFADLTEVEATLDRLAGR